MEVAHSPAQNPVNRYQPGGVVGGRAFPPCLTPPDQQVPFRHGGDMERVLHILFLHWNPAGKKRKGRATESEVADWVDGMLLSPDPEEHFEWAHHQVRPFGWRLIGLFSRFGVKLEVSPKEEYSSRHGHTLGKYYADRRTAVIREDAFYQDFTTAHEMGHALEHLISSLCLGGHSLATRMWHTFADQRKGFVTEYAATRPTEYFAESVEAFFRDDQWWLLEEWDPGMYDFLDTLFTISNM